MLHNLIAKMLSIWRPQKTSKSGFDPQQDIAILLKNSFIFTKFKISAQIRIMYDGGFLLILGGAPPGGVPYMHVFLLGGTKRLLYWGTIMVTVEFDTKKSL